MNATTSATIPTTAGTLPGAGHAAVGALRVLGVALPLIGAPLLWWGLVMAVLRVTAPIELAIDGDRRLGAWGREAGAAAWPHPDIALGAIGVGMLLLACGGCCRLLRRQRTWGAAAIVEQPPAGP